MKYCDKCKKSFPDNQAFCSQCGSKLNASPVNADGAGTDNSYSGNTSRASDDRINFWLPVILAGIGTAFGYFFSGLAGVIIGALGTYMAYDQKKQGDYDPIAYVLTWILEIINVLMWLYVIDTVF